jgi:lysophospholipase L1-like esterase
VQEEFMRSWYLYLLVVGIGTGAFGCAASHASDEEVGLEAQPQTLEEEERLLALGDSIAFGYSPFADFSQDKNFVGYPEVLKSDHAVDALKNSSCPGESSASFFSTTAPDNGCRAYRSNYPLHVNYGRHETQLDYALARVTSEEADDVPTLITLNISGNDIFLLQKACANDPRGPAACFAAGAPALIGSVARNVATILGRLRAAGYHGQIVYMNLYSGDYTNPSTLAFLGALNATVSNVARQFGAQIANAFGAFGAASAPYGGNACAAGLLIPLPSGTGCDVHPSALGASLLAQTVIDAQ